MTASRSLRQRCIARARDPNALDATIAAIAIGRLRLAKESTVVLYCLRGSRSIASILIFDFRPPAFQPRAATVGTGGVRNYVPKNIEIASGFEDQPR